jgi:hypothetical protein
VEAVDQAEEEVQDDSQEFQDQGVSALAAGFDPCAQAGPLDDPQVEPTAEVPSLRGFGEGRRAILKRRAEVFTRSTCEAFSFVASKTLSQKDARDIMETFCNVSLP